MGDVLSTPEAVDRFVKLFCRMDEDKSCTLGLEEFLRLLRIWSTENTVNLSYIAKPQELHRESRASSQTERKSLWLRRASTTMGYAGPSKDPGEAERMTGTIL